jgi:hypothetical protein
MRCVYQSNETKTLFKMKYVHAKMLELKSQKAVIKSAGTGQRADENTGILKVLAPLGMCCFWSGLLILFLTIIY